MLQVILSNYKMSEEVKTLIEKKLKLFENFRDMFNTYEWCEKSLPEILEYNDPDIITECLMKGIITTAIVNANTEDEVMDIILSMIEYIHSSYMRVSSFRSSIARCYTNINHENNEILFSELNNEETEELVDDLWDEKILLQEAMKGVFDNLREICGSDRNTAIFMHYIGIDCPEKLSLREIGKIYKLSPDRVRQIVAKIIRKLKHPYNFKYICEYQEFFRTTLDSEMMFKRIDDNYYSSKVSLKEPVATTNGRLLNMIGKVVVKIAKSIQSDDLKEGMRCTHDEYHVEGSGVIIIYNPLTKKTYDVYVFNSGTGIEKEIREIDKDIVDIALGKPPKYSDDFEFGTKRLPSSSMKRISNHMYVYMEGTEIPNIPSIYEKSVKDAMVDDTVCVMKNVHNGNDVNCTHSTLFNEYTGMYYGKYAIRRVGGEVISIDKKDTIKYHYPHMNIMIVPAQRLSDQFFDLILNTISIDILEHGTKVLTLKDEVYESPGCCLPYYKINYSFDFVAWDSDTIGVDSDIKDSNGINLPNSIIIPAAASHLFIAEHVKYMEDKIIPLNVINIDLSLL